MTDSAGAEQDDAVVATGSFATYSLLGADWDNPEDTTSGEEDVTGVLEVDSDAAVKCSDTNRVSLLGSCGCTSTFDGWLHVGFDAFRGEDRCLADFDFFEEVLLGLEPAGVLGFFNIFTALLLHMFFDIEQTDKAELLGVLVLEAETLMLDVGLFIWLLVDDAPWVEV